jgi:transcriptional regulator with XRE-family HTH domain
MASSSKALNRENLPRRPPREMSLALFIPFGKEVRRRRTTLGLTLDQLAERAGLTPNYIGTVENGRRDPSLSTVIALARGLGVPTGELLGGVGELGPMAVEAARLLQGTPLDLQGAVIELLRAIGRRRR